MDPDTLEKPLINSEMPGSTVLELLPRCRKALLIEISS